MVEQAGAGGATGADDAATSAICNAASLGNVALLRQIMVTGASVNQQNSAHLTPLHCAIAGEQVECVRELLKHPQIDVHAQWEEEVCVEPGMSEGEGVFVYRCVKTPLHWAVRQGPSAARQQIVTLLLEHGADILKTSGDLGGRTAFDEACKRGDFEMVKFLFEERKDVLLPKNQWVTPPSNKLPHCHAAKADRHQSYLVDRLLEIDDRYKVTYSHEQLTQMVELGDACLLRGVLRRRKQQMTIEFDLFLFSKARISCHILDLLLSQGCRAYRVDSETGRLTLLLEHRQWRNDTYAFKICIQYTPPDIVQRYNEQCAASAVQSARHPLAIALSGTDYFRSALLLLEAGFDPTNLVWHHGDVQNATHLRGIYLAVAETFGYEQCSFNAASRAILTFSDWATDFSIYGKLIGALSQSGASMVAKNTQQISPLTLLAVKCYQCEIKPDVKLRLYRQELFTIFHGLINSDTDLSYRRVTPHMEPFICPDVAIALALVGNTRILSHLVSKLGLIPHHLLSDLLAVVKLKFGTNPRFSTMIDNQKILIGTIGTSALKLLQYGAKSPSLLKLCSELRAKMSTAYTSQLPQYTSLGQQAIQRIAQDNLWKKIFEEFERVDCLQHMCRVTIVERLTQSKVGGSFGEKVEAITEIPPSIRKYLTFPDELEYPEPDDKKDEK